MKEDEYNLLKRFPKDKSYLSQRHLDEITKGKLDYNSLVDLCNSLYYAELIEGFMSGKGLRITEKGLKAIPFYEATTKRESEIAELNYKKLKYDVRNAERVYKTYTTTRLIAWVTFIVMLILAALKISEVIRVWPYHK
jgi:hypothetical protein